MFVSPVRSAEPHSIQRSITTPTHRAPLNASPDADEIDAATEAWLRDYYADSNRELEEQLGRRLPWPQQAGVL